LRLTFSGKFAVEIYAPIRRFVFVEGKSRREATMG
jgi:hypothetical protein